MKQSPVNDPKIEEYGRYFNENLSKKQTGNLELLPERRFDLYPAALEFIARGGFQSPLKALSIKDDGIKDDGKERNKKYDVGKLFAPLTTHVKDGRILPFKTIDIGFYSTNVNDDELCPSIQELAKQIAAHPEAYYNLEQIKIKNQGNRRFDKGAYLNLLDELIKLAEDPKNPLSCAINITEVAALLAEYQNKGNQKKEEFEEELILKSDKLNSLIARNRRKINYKLLQEGDNAFGITTATGFVPQTIIPASDEKEIRACKRTGNLAEALKNAAIEQEMEEEEEEEQEQEQEQEQEMEQEEQQEQAYGQADDNLSNVQEFIAYAKVLGKHINEDDLKSIWHGLLGDVFDENSQSYKPLGQLTALSKDIAGKILNDPNAFKFGVVDNNLPQGFCIGLLNVAGKQGKVEQKRGIYFDPTAEAEPTPLAIKIYEPPPPRPKIKVTPFHFLEKFETVENLEKEWKKLFDWTLKENDLWVYNLDNKDLFENTEIRIAHKITFMTSTKSYAEFQKWAKRDITINLFNTDRAGQQNLAIAALTFSGDAIFDLTDKLEKIKKVCKQNKSIELFQPFLENTIIKSIQEGHSLFEHDQFTALDKIVALKGEELNWFLSFCNKHAEHNSPVDLSALINSFTYFKTEYAKLTDSPLPVESLENLVKDCKNMNVGLDRVLFILKKAKEHGLLEEQLQVLTKLNLHYAGAYHLVKNFKYKIVLPEMNIPLEDAVVAKRIKDKANISDGQYVAIQAILEGNPTHVDCKSLYYRQFAVAETVPDYKNFDVLTNFIESISEQDYHNPDKVKVFLHTFSGFCLYHKEGINDFSNPDLQSKLVGLAKAVDNLGWTGSKENDSSITNFLLRFADCQASYFKEKMNQYPPTLERFTTFIEMIKRLKDSQKVEIDQVMNFSNFFRAGQDVFTPLYKLSVRKGNKLSDENLFEVFEKLKSKRLDKNILNISGGILHALALIENPKKEKLDAFLNDIEKICKGDNATYEIVVDTLKILEFADIESLASPPTLENLKNLLAQAALNPQADYAANLRWINTQPGFENIRFNIANLKPKAVSSKGFTEAFNGEKQGIVEGLNQAGILIEGIDQMDFKAFINALKLQAKEDNLIFKNIIFPKLKDFVFKSNIGSLTFIQDENLGNLNPEEKASIKDLFLKISVAPTDDPKTLDALLVLSDKYQSAHNEFEKFCIEVNKLKNKYPKKFQAINQNLNKLQPGQIPNESLTELLKILGTQEFFNLNILSMAVSHTPRLESDSWQLMNKFLPDILEHPLINKPEMFDLCLKLISQKNFNQSSVEKLITLSEKSVEIYNAAVALLAKQPSIDLKDYSNNISSLSAKLDSQDSLVNLLNQREENKDVDPEKIQALLNTLNSVSNDKLISLMTILKRSIKTSDIKSLTSENLNEQVISLSSLEKITLERLASCELDGPYPTLDILRDNAQALKNNSLSVEGFLQAQEDSYFKKKNAPAELAKIFNDDRVIPVINDSRSLEYTEPVGLPLELKQKLREDYAYIHAIGLNAPVYNNKAIKDLTKDELKTYQSELIEKIRNQALSEEERHLANLQFIALVREACYRSQGKMPYSTQIISLLMALNNPKMNMEEIKTGEGKSLTAGGLDGILLWAQGRPVVIITHNMTQANDDLKENRPLYEYLNIPCRVIEKNSKATDFEHQGINYSAPSDMALFLAKTDIQQSLKIMRPALILDEADFTVLDEITDFKYAVDLSGAGLSNEVNQDEWLYYALNEFVDSDEFKNSKVTRGSDVVLALRFLGEKLKQEIATGRIKAEAAEHIQTRLGEFSLPGGEGAKRLDTWIDSAANAKVIFEQGRGTAWTIEQYVHKDGQTYSAAKIISHHRVAHGSKWSKGIHQFVHARINSELAAKENIPPCRIDSEKAHVAALSSKNFVDYFIKRDGCVWGMTGTIGSAAERAELQRKYGFHLTQIEPHKKRIAVDLKPIFTANAKAHVNAIFGHVKAYAINKKQMPVLIVEEDATKAQEFKERFLAKLTQEPIRLKGKTQPNVQFYNGLEYEFYEYNAQDKKYQIKTDIPKFKTIPEKERYIKEQAGKQNTITITAPLMGRGTDFKPMEFVNKIETPHSDGLFVINAYPEASEREERQISGRKGRQGAAGLYINIIDKNRFVSKLEDIGVTVSPLVSYFMPKKLTQKLPVYRASKNESHAKERQLKQAFSDVRGYYYERFLGMFDLINQEENRDKLIALLRDKEGFDEKVLNKQFSDNLMRYWSKFLTRIDSEFVRLRDEKKGDLDAIMESLEKYSHHLWNEEMIEALKNTYGLERNEDAQYLFAPYRARIDARAFVNEVMVNSQYEEAKDPDQTVQRDEIRDVYINYPKDYWAKHKAQLNQEGSENREEILYEIFAMDLLNNVVALNEKLSHDKLINLAPINIAKIVGLRTDLKPDELKRAILRQISQNPDNVFKSLFEQFTRVNYEAQCLRIEANAKENPYADLDKMQKLSMAGFVEGIAQGELFINSINETQLKYKKEIVSARVPALRSPSPEKALVLQIEQPGAVYKEYSLADIKKDIKADIALYLKDKTKMFNRKKTAAELLKSLDVAHRPDQIFSCLLASRQQAMDEDLSAKNRFALRNKMGSRYQVLLNKCLTRMIVQANDQESLLVAADFIRKEMIEQIEFLLKNGDLDKKEKEVFDPILRDLGTYVPADAKTTLETLFKCEKQLKNQAILARLSSMEPTPTSIAFGLLRDNLAVVNQLESKVRAKQIDMNTVIPYHKPEIAPKSVTETKTRPAPIEALRHFVDEKHQAAFVKEKEKASAKAKPEGQEQEFVDLMNKLYSICAKDKMSTRDAKMYVDLKHKVDKLYNNSSHLQQKRIVNNLKTNFDDDPSNIIHKVNAQNIVKLLGTIDNPRRRNLEAAQKGAPLLPPKPKRGKSS